MRLKPPAHVAYFGGLFGCQRAERRHVQAAVKAVQLVAARQTIGGEGDDALERRMAAAGEGDESLALEIGIQRLLALDAEHDRQVEANGRQPRHQRMHAVGLEPHDLAGVRDRVRGVGFGENGAGNKSLGFGMEGRRNVDRDVGL